MGDIVETVLAITAVLGVVGAILLFMLSRVPSARVTALGLLVLSGVLGWIAWSDVWTAGVR
ncbi:hypothetical protein EDC65_1960 [Stella humosa]|uniref:Uncharacterized protein n=1 Tax=Stella humosa TaxID=94 RepID=A0A3N1LY78_9PROT|nr:hypothetical protein [Stella humosa]ROQ00164.1 hypothetical protein EDC65_1960 [Stella humosa]BBK30602.1 hypothetical protein STHU_12360 [Stella humosa]